jgi:hypothetical protein
MEVLEGRTGYQDVGESVDAVENDNTCFPISIFVRPDLTPTQIAGKTLIFHNESIASKRLFLPAAKNGAIGLAILHVSIYVPQRPARPERPGTIDIPIGAGNFLRPNILAFDCKRRRSSEGLMGDLLMLSSSTGALGCGSKVEITRDCFG